MRGVTLRLLKLAKPAHLLLILLVAAATAGAAVHYVDLNSPNPLAPFTGWSTAATNIQHAVDVAAPGDEIVVTNGVYATGGRPVGMNDLINRVIVDKPITIRSANGPGQTVIKGSHQPGASDPSYAATRCVYLCNGAVLNGFTVTNGATREFFNPGWEGDGGGIWCQSESAVVTNCTITGSYAEHRGGGVFGGTLKNCTVVGNMAHSGAGAAQSKLINCMLSGNPGSGFGYRKPYYGGGAYESTLTNCTVSGNWADYGGGAYSSSLYNCTVVSNSYQGVTGSTLNHCEVSYNGDRGAVNSTLNNCTVSRNSGGGSSGGTLNNCVITGNSAESGGGAYGGTLNNCTLTGNWAQYGGGVRGGRLNNCIVYYNTALLSGPNYEGSIFNFSCTTPLPQTGAGNISNAPGLLDAWHLSSTSACRGAGNLGFVTGTDLDGDAWLNPPSIGCDEYWSRSLSGPLSVSIAHVCTNVALGSSAEFKAIITGSASALSWDLGDGTVVSNQLHISHKWIAAGDYSLVLRVYNENFPAGVATSLSVHVLSSPMHFVMFSSTNPVAPYTNWNTAARTVQDAVDAAFIGGEVLVDDGIYELGDRLDDGDMRARVVVNKPLTLRSVHGPDSTIIKGAANVRCVHLTNRTVLSGFTLTSGRADGTNDFGSSGGAVFGSFDSLVTNCIIRGNFASSRGGGTYGGTLSGCVLSNNMAVMGGAAYRSILSNCTVSANVASGSGGGVVDCAVNSSVISSNSAQSGGGGAYLGTITESTLSDNNATMEGGAVRETIVSRSTITGNSAYNGGGAYQSELNGCVLRGNRARGHGGGTYSGQLSNCLIHSNSAPEGGGAYAGWLKNCTVVENSAELEWGGGGTEISSLYNCIVYCNTANRSSNYSGGAFAYSCTTPLPPEGEANISVEPQFAGIAEGDFRLVTNSPCINTGENSYSDGPTDLDGNARIVSNTVDMGAYEFQTPILSAPRITTQPWSQTVQAQERVSFTVKAKGYPLNYQWRFNGKNISGATLSALNLEQAMPAHAGGYSVEITNTFGSVTSAVATLSVNWSAPSERLYFISGHTPTAIGSSLRLGSYGGGIPPPSIQWQLNGDDLPGQTNSSLYLPNLQSSQTGTYTLVASNVFGTARATAVITVIEPVAVLAYFATAPPPLMVGSDQAFDAEVSLPSTEFLEGLQWCFNGNVMAGATNQTLLLNHLDAHDVGEYSVVAYTSSGNYTSPPITLSIYYEAPSHAEPWIMQGSSSALVGTDVRLAADYYGSPSDIQWCLNGEALPGQTNWLLALLAVTTNQAGQYSFIASNVSGMTTSTVVRLTVEYQPPLFVSDPASQSVVEGTTARFQAWALAGPPPVYFLEHNGTNVAVPLTYTPWGGEASGGFSLLDTTIADAGDYRIIATNWLGSATSTVAALTVTVAGPLDRWTRRNPLPQADPIYAIAHGTNQFVAVGDRGTILTSSDGSNWTLQSRRVDLPLNGVAYGDGVFVAVGAGGTILSSSDGTNWAYRFTAADTSFDAVTYGAGRFVAVGSRRWCPTVVMYSTDGVKWEEACLDGYAAGYGVTYGNGLFVAVGGASIMVSIDGKNWTLAQSLNNELESVTYAAGLYVAVGDDGAIWVSANGISWAQRTPVVTRRLLGVTHGGGRFVAVGARGAMVTSQDGVTWTSVASGTPDRLETIGFSDGLFTAAGENGTIITSSNGTNWTKQNFGITRDLDGMEVANGRLVVVGKGGSILTSTDGINYTTQNGGVSNDLHGVTWGGGLWVAVGERGGVLTSSNGSDWISHDSGTTNSLKDATYAGGQWIAVGTEGTIVRSRDGVNWTSIFTSPAYDLNGVAYGNGVFLVAGDGPSNQNGSVFRSQDGVSWSQVNFNPGKNLRGVKFADGAFFFPANDGQLFQTTNGTAGSFNMIANLSNLSAGNLRDLTFGAGLWTLVGNDGAIFTSMDLVSWTRRASHTFENLHGVAYLDGKLIVIGNRGTVLQSWRFVAEFEPPAFALGTGLQLPFKGVLNRAYRLQATTNLVNWIDLATFTNQVERSVFTDADALQYDRRFYRLVQP